MGKKYFDIEIEYTVTELIEVEAENVDEAEELALEMLRNGATQHNIVGDNTDEAEVTRSGESAQPQITEED